MIEIRGGGVNLALLKDNKYGNTRFFFLKGKMIVHEIKNKHLRDSMSEFLIHLNLKKNPNPFWEELQKYIMQYLVRT